MGIDEPDVPAQDTDLLRFGPGEQLQFSITCFLLTAAFILHHYSLAVIKSENQTLYNIAVLGAFMPAVYNMHLRVWMMVQ